LLLLAVFGVVVACDGGPTLLPTGTCDTDAACDPVSDVAADVAPDAALDVAADVALDAASDVAADVAPDAAPRDAPVATFYVPAETVTHKRTWMAWPDRTAIWGSDLPRVQAAIATIARTIAKYEPVTLLANPSSSETAQAMCGPSVTVMTTRV
jgi:hypothetical protein